MQKITPQRRAAGGLGWSAIQAVAHDGVADAGQVHADLVRAASADLDFKQREMREAPQNADRKSTRLNSSHSQISYAVFCLKKKKKNTKQTSKKDGQLQAGA